MGGWKRRFFQVFDLVILANYDLIESGQGTENGEEAMLD
jgi:hypothetical protein